MLFFVGVEVLFVALGLIWCFSPQGKGRSLRIDVTGLEQGEITNVPNDEEGAYVKVFLYRFERPLIPRS